MNNLNVKNYKDYVEVVNGLFTVDKVRFEIGLDDLEEAVIHVFAQDRPIRERGVVSYTGNPFIEDESNRALQEGVQREVERARIENERLSLQLRNMSEQQLLEHFDRISQEEE